MLKGKSTLESAQRKWEENTQEKGEEYCEGLARFLGVKACNPAIEKAFTEGVKGKGAKWARNYAKKMAGT
jgi:hypothetical protein